MKCLGCLFLDADQIIKMKAKLTKCSAFPGVSFQSLHQKIYLVVYASMFLQSVGSDTELIYQYIIAMLNPRGGQRMECTVLLP